jgi:glycine/D-amino acid oxidase-like deaminating enzyme
VTLPRTAEAVVIGGGSTGASIAYHLARRGVRDVVLLEQGFLASDDTTPDFQFVLDRAPGIEGLVVAVGFSGHGFKHSPIIGDLVADLVLGTTPADPHLDLGFFALGRFAAGRPHQPRHRYARVLLGR